ncbi:platelet glycoprotein IX-like [Tiliqua scincoides]|uniref:platelet glycoprotein IX-like n=1 Tax=Tiliqua scincoides TaxID=71010 RepID=UPI0034624A09
MHKMKMSPTEGLVMLLLLSTAEARNCSPCICEYLEETWTWKVDCSSLGLIKIPPLVSAHIRILYLQNNRLTTVRPGTLDILRNVKELNMSNNPWNCDCSILYLKQWLEDSHPASLANATCATPAHLRTKSLSQLSGNELEGCRKLLPIKCLDFLWRDLILILMAILVLIFASCILHYSKKLVSQVSRKQQSCEVPLLPWHELETQKIRKRL